MKIPDLLREKTNFVGINSSALESQTDNYVGCNNPIIAGDQVGQGSRLPSPVGGAA